MVASSTGVRAEDVAHNLYSVIIQFVLHQPRLRRRPAGLKELEFLALAVLQQQGSMIVGDIQRVLGVLPAQMSRIIRALEARDRPLITCRINPQDKRKIDVCLTTSGEKALQDYRDEHLAGLAALLGRLSDEDQEDLGRLLEKIHVGIDRRQLT